MSASSIPGTGAREFSLDVSALNYDQRLLGFGIQGFQSFRILPQGIHSLCLDAKGLGAKELKRLEKFSVKSRERGFRDRQICGFLSLLDLSRCWI